jgi:hypothetical protein
VKTSRVARRSLSSVGVAIKAGSTNSKAARLESSSARLPRSMSPSVIDAVAAHIARGVDGARQPAASGGNAAAGRLPPPLPAGPSLDHQYRLGPDSLPQVGVPKGELRGPYTLPCEVFPGTQHRYWVYVPAQYDAAVPAALMVFQDGQAFVHDRGDIRAQNVLDNLIHRREIPVMVAVFINPGRTPEQVEPSPAVGWGDGAHHENRPPFCILPTGSCQDRLGTTTRKTLRWKHILGCLQALRIGASSTTPPREVRKRSFLAIYI